MTISQTHKGILVTAWIVILSIALIKITLQEVFHYPVSDTIQALISGMILTVCLGLTFLWKSIRPLRQFLFLFLMLILVQWFIYSQVDQLPIFQKWLGNPSFNVYMLAEKSLGLLLTLAIITVLILLKKKWSAFFMTWGDISAPVELVKWLGLKKGQKWSGFGRTLAIILGLGTLTFLVSAGRPSPDLAARALPFLPAVLLAAALNAFNEEMTYKASFLSTLVQAVGRQQALWMVAAYFGIWHYYGIPYGVIGVLMAGFLGWLLGKSMLETGGVFWAWFLHFIQDVFIFSFLAIGSIAPGG